MEMEGFECKLVSSSGSAWPFDPLSQELLLLQKLPPLGGNASSSEQQHKLLAFSTLNLNTSSLSPFDLNLNLPTEGPEEGIGVKVEDINNNSGLIGVSFLTNLEALDAVAPSPTASSTTTQDSPSQNNRVHILKSCFATNHQSQGLQNPVKMPARTATTQEDNSASPHPLPKFEEIHFDHSQNIRHSQNSSQHHDEVDVDDVDGIYFNIQDLDQYDRDGKGYLIEDLMDCPPTTDPNNPTNFLQLPPPTLESIDLLADDDDDDVDDDGEETEGRQNLGQTPNSNSNSFDDHLDLDLDDKGDTDTYSMDMDLDPPLMLMVEGEEGEKGELKCKFCGFVCCSKSSLGIHERRHTGERPYSCKFCMRLFNSAQCCKHHERLHTGDKPFECQYCGKKYAVSTRLKRHERVHTREEPYKCGEPGCGKTFRWFDAFRDHRNTHNGIPLYLCSVCGKSFFSYLKFYYHERGHFLKRERDRDRDRAKKLLQQQQQNGAATNMSTTAKNSPTTIIAKKVKKSRPAKMTPTAKPAGI